MRLIERIQGMTHQKKVTRLQTKKNDLTNCKKEGNLVTKKGYKEVTNGVTKVNEERKCMECSHLSPIENKRYPEHTDKHSFSLCTIMDRGRWPLQAACGDFKQNINSKEEARRKWEME